MNYNELSKETQFFLNKDEFINEVEKGLNAECQFKM